MTAYDGPKNPANKQEPDAIGEWTLQSTTVMYHTGRVPVHCNNLPGDCRLKLDF